MYTRGLYGVREGNMAFKDNNNSMSLVLVTGKYSVRENDREV